jgi:hypothetical protein
MKMMKVGRKRVHSLINWRVTLTLVMGVEVEEVEVLLENKEC